MSPWSLPNPPWVLHTSFEHGRITERWIGLQAETTDRFETRILARRAGTEFADSPRWLPAERAIDRLAYWAAWGFRGRASAWFAQPLRDSRPAVVHAHYGTWAARLLPLCRRLEAPLVASFYGYDATNSRITESRRWRRGYDRLFASVGAVIAEGPAMGARIEALGCPAERIRVVRLPADVESLSRVQVERADGFQVAVAGRFAEKKGFDVAIRAFARALGGRSDARLLLVGGGETEAELRRVVAEERIEDQVEWAGRLPFQRFMSLVGGSDLGLYPSRTARDGDSEGGAPVTLIEAQWLGVPSIVSDHDDLPFAAPEGSLVLPATDVDAWAAALRDLYESPERARAMGEAARRHVRIHHTPEANCRAREGIYAELSARS